MRKRKMTILAWTDTGVRVFHVEGHILDVETQAEGVAADLNAGDNWQLISGWVPLFMEAL